VNITKQTITLFVCCRLSAHEVSCFHLHVQENTAVSVQGIKYKFI